MTELLLPKDGPRVPPMPPEAVNAFVQSEYDKTVRTWGIPNNLVRTMGCHPGLALTEVDYANSFIFDEGTITRWPTPGDPTPGKTVPFPVAGFVDRVTKELVINLVSLLNRSRYSITHHSVIGYLTLSAVLPDATPEARAARAEEMLYWLAGDDAKATFENRSFLGQPLYSELQLHALRLAVKLQGDAHDVTDAEFGALKTLLHKDAEARVTAGLLAGDPSTRTPQYLGAYVNGMLVELTWCIVHFAGLLNKWFTVLKVMDETDEKRDGIDFVSNYNKTVPERIKVRNNNILGPDGWGGRS